MLRVAKWALKPWHRISLYRDFWKTSERIVSGWQPDLVQSCDLEGLVGAATVARRRRVPHLHDCHELFLERVQFTRLERTVLAQVERRTIRTPSLVTVVNASIGGELRRRYGVATITVRNCADKPDHVEPKDVRELAALAPHTPVVLYQGGLLRGRGLTEVVRSAAYYPSGVALVLLGYGTLRDELEALARAEGLSDRVRFVDAVPPDDLLSFTASATVGVVPYQPVSLNNRLALPNKIFEYLAVGLPVVVSDIPELRAIVAASGCGELYDSFDPASLGAAVRRLLEPERRSAAGQAARAYGQANTWRRERSILEDVYRRLSA
jgi:glycosyltransferase involved in cell wall biosynthesis